VIQAILNGEEVIRVVDERLTSGQPGVFQESDVSGGTWRLDNFFAGNLANAVLGEGVWITNRGAGSYSYFTADSGQQYLVPSTVTLQVTVVDFLLSPIGIQGVEVRIEVRVPGPGTGAEIAAGTTNAQGVFSASFNYTADVEVDVIVRRSSVFSPRMKRYEPVRTPATITSGGLTQTVEMTEDPNATNP
jgi:hypothetical protein